MNNTIYPPTMTTTNNYSYSSLENNVDIIQDTYRIGYLMEDIRVTYRHDINITVGSIIINAKEGDISSIPRWIAKNLSEYGIIEMQDNDTSTYISRALNRERIAKPHDLSGLDSDFYIRVDDYLGGLKDRERENLIVSLNSFVASRLEKIVKLAAASPLSPELEQKLSAEENELYTIIHHSSSIFKQKVLKKFG
jgi:DNA replication factor GINS